MSECLINTCMLCHGKANETRVLAPTTTKRQRSTIDEFQCPSPVVNESYDYGEEFELDQPTAPGSRSLPNKEQGSGDEEPGDGDTAQPDNGVVCSLHCCSSNAPYFPVSSDLTATKRKQGRQMPSLCLNWFDVHKWLTYC